MHFSPQEFKEHINGIVSIITTPYDDNYELDERALREQIDYIKSNFKGDDSLTFLAGGSVGEFYALSDEEWLRFAKIVVDEVNGEFPVMVGSGRAGTQYSIELTKKAAEIGADGVTIINPYYLPPTTEGLYRHLEAIAKSTDIAIITYDNHFTSKITIPPSVLARISKIDNVIANKENQMNALMFKALLDAVDPQDLKIITGAAEGMYAWTCMYDSPAFISTNATIVPELTKEFLRAGKAKDSKKLDEILKKEAELGAFTVKVASARSPIPAVEAPSEMSYIDPVVQSVYKKAQDLIGLHGGRTRGPMEDNLTEEEIEELRGILRRLGCNVVA